MNSAVIELLAKCHTHRVVLRVGADGKLQVSPHPSKLPPALVAELRNHKQEIVELLTQRQFSCHRLEVKGESVFVENTHVDSAPDSHSFLPLPLSKTSVCDPWEAWEPLFLWLSEHAPERFNAIYEAEEAIQQLEKAGITAGEAYDLACAALFLEFETARRLCMASRVRVWLQ